MADISLQLAWIGLTLLTKAMLWDDEDEDDSPRRKAHNLFTNRFMQLSSQAAQYVNWYELSTTITDMSIVRFVSNVAKLANETSDYIQGDDIIKTGINAGESALLNQSEKVFLPSLFRSGFGFETQAERQFLPSQFDNTFKGPEKQASEIIQGLRAKQRKELESKNLSEKEINKLLYKKYPKKKKNQSYANLLNQIDIDD